MQITHWLRRWTWASFAVLLCSCNWADATESRNHIAGIYIGIGWTGYTSDVFLTLGDRDSLQAQAFSGGWPNRTIYDSSIEPTRFHYSSTRRDVATVDSTGHITTVGVGETALTASVRGVLSPSIRLSVQPPATAIVTEPTTVTARVGDTFAVSVRALDSTGQSVPGVVFNMGLDTTWWAVTSEPLEGDWKLHTPLVLHFKAQMAGRVKLVATVQHERPELRYQAVVPVTVVSP